MIPRGRQIHKTFNNIKITILCDFSTIFILRGIINTGNISNSNADVVNQNLIEEANRILTEIYSDKDPTVLNDLNQNPKFPSHFTHGKPEFCCFLVRLPTRAVKNKIDYCRIHGIEIIYNMAHLDKELARYWGKLPMIRRLMVDAMFTDMVFEIPLSKYSKHNLVIHGYPDLLFDQKLWIALNIRSFFWSLDLLDAWAPMGPKGPIREEVGKILTANLKGRPEFEVDNQSTLIYLLLSQKDQWMDKAGLVDWYEEMIEEHHPSLSDERWPFVTHFLGCKPYGSYGDYPVEKCLKSMERAFNFADKQVLKLYGFGYRGLLSPKIKRIRNETVTPLNYVDQFDIHHSVHPKELVDPRAKRQRE
ncbi:hypothetical protein K2173_000230 [Erythroxylum novogranatense]|uniref:Uncharacterized protein n=1 Tax=Erythroxylum novogranatense TaxID=1862640 RepID=A0AAV8SWL1_9ROSI|nr:hypothetical protein K2173_000230 [Erythroxylum novogranatense]